MRVVQTFARAIGGSTTSCAALICEVADRSEQSAPPMRVVQTFARAAWTPRVHRGFDVLRVHSEKFDTDHRVAACGR